MEVLKLETWTSTFSPEVLVPDKVQEYLDFVAQAVERYDPERYSEWHHVIPKSLDFEKKFLDQGVYISGYDHFLSHKLLVECFKGRFKCKMSCAVAFMSGHSKVDLTPEEYEEVRKVLRDNNPASDPEVQKKMSDNHADFSGKNHPMFGVSRYGPDNPFFGKVHSEETRQRISLTRKEKGSSRGEKNPMYGVRLYGDQNPMYGRVHSEESREKMSKLKQGSGNPCYGKICINDGKVNRYIPKDSQIPEGWTKGKVIRR